MVMVVTSEGWESKGNGREARVFTSGGRCCAAVG